MIRLALSRWRHGFEPRWDCQIDQARGELLGALQLAPGRRTQQLEESGNSPGWNRLVKSHIHVGIRSHRKPNRLRWTDWHHPILRRLQSDWGHHPRNVGLSESGLPRHTEVIPGPLPVYWIRAGLSDHGDRTVRLETRSRRPDGNRCGPAGIHRLDESRYLVRPVPGEFDARSVIGLNRPTVVHPSTAMNRKLPVPSFLNPIEPGPSSSIASRSHRSISMIRHLPIRFIVSPRLRSQLVSNVQDSHPVTNGIVAASWEVHDDDRVDRRIR